MKKLCAFLVITVLMVPALGTTAMAVGSASVSITNTKSVQQSRSYTYTISVKISSSFDFTGAIHFSGVFSHSDIDLDFHAASNSSKTLSKSVTLKIPANAELGSTGKITVSGQGDYLDANDNPIEYPVSKSLTATVIKYVPTPTKKPTEWDIAAQGVTNLKAEGALSMKAAADTSIPAALLSALKEKQAKLTVDLGNCTCEIDGAALSDISSDGSIDLAVTMEKDALLSEAAGGADIYQLHFAHSGQLPGPFAYTFKADANKPGDTLYLYFFYDWSGVAEGVQSAVVDENGYVTFRIYHCSSYFATGSMLQGAFGIIAWETENPLAPTATPVLSTVEPLQETPEPAGTELQAGLAEVQAQLKAAQDYRLELENRINEKDAQLADARRDAEAFMAESAGRLSVDPTVLVLLIGAAALLAVFLTMLFCRAGLFKRRNQ
jgi:hypothetical protein